MADSLLVKPEAPIGKIGSADDVLDIFKEGEEEIKEQVRQKEPKEKEEPEPKGDDDEIELKELDEETDKLDLDADDNIEIGTPPRKQEILKEFPELFKKFPFLEKVLYRDREYTQLFGSFDDAKELAERAEVFSSFESQLLKGDTTEILKNVKDTDSKAFDKIVDNYLPNLYKADKEAYFDVVNNLNKRLISEMVNEANTSSDEDLKQAALLVNQFLFNTSKYTPPQTRSAAKPDDEAKNEVEQERLALVQERFESSLNELQTKVDNTLKATIAEYIDPRGAMSAYVKKNAINDALNLVNKAMSNDPSTRSTLDKLWRATTDAKFSRESLGKIQSFYLGKAKPVLASAIKRAKAEALKDTSPRREKEEEIEEERTPRNRGPITAGRPSGQTRQKDGMKKGESVADFFARD